MVIILDMSDHFIDVRDWTSCDSNLILTLYVFLLLVLSLGFSLPKQWFYGYWYSPLKLVFNRAVTCVSH